MADDERGQAREAAGQRGSTRLSPRVIVGLVIGACVLLFVLVNSQDTRISFIFFHTMAPLWVALALAAGGGFGAGFLLGRRRYRR